MASIKELNKKLLFEREKDKNEKDEKDQDEKDENKEENKKNGSKLRAKEYRDTLQNYKGRISGTAVLDVDYKDLKTKLEKKLPGMNWTKPNVKKTFEVVTQMIGVQPKDEK